MAISDKKRKEDQACRCAEIMTKWKVLVAVGAGMSVLFSFFADAKIKTLGKPCLAKNNTGLKHCHWTIVR